MQLTGFAPSQQPSLKKETFRKWGMIYHEPCVSNPIPRYGTSNYAGAGVSLGTNELLINDNTSSDFIKFWTYPLPLTDTIRTQFTHRWITKGSLWFAFTKPNGSNQPSIGSDAIQVGFNINTNDVVTLQVTSGGTSLVNQDFPFVLPTTSNVQITVTPSTIAVTINGVIAGQINNPLTSSVYKTFTLAAWQTRQAQLTNVALSAWDIYALVALLDRPRYEMTFAGLLKLQADRLLNAQQTDGSFKPGKDIYGSLSLLPSLVTSHCAILLYKAYLQSGNEKYRTAAVNANNYVAGQQQADGTWNQGGHLINQVGRQLFALVLLSQYENITNWNTAIANAKNSVQWDATTGKWKPAAGNTSITTYNAINQQVYVNAALWMNAVKNVDTATQTNCETLLTGYLNTQLLTCGLWPYDENGGNPNSQNANDRMIHYSSLVLWCIDQMKRYSPSASIWSNTTVMNIINGAVNGLKSSFPLNFYANSSSLWVNYPQTDAPAYLISIMDYHGASTERDLFIEAFADTWFSQACLGGSANDGLLDRTFNAHIESITALSLADASLNLSFRYGDIGKRFLY